MKKRKREYTNLKDAVGIVNNLAMAIMVILAIAGILASIAGAGAAFEDDKTLVFIGTIAPFIAYIVVVYAASFVTKSVLAHLMRMEIIALDGPDVFESEEERAIRIKEEKKKEEEDWKKF